jgi:Holliday junction resolvase RusA-like endonuclease
MSYSAVVYIAPMGAPRMTQRDKWKRRPVVMRYRAFKDALRAACVGHPARPLEVSWRAYLPIPKSYSKQKRAALMGQPHRAKPDRDNIDKAILDALFPDDSVVAEGYICKFWDDGQGARIEITMQD